MIADEAFVADRGRGGEAARGAVGVQLADLDDGGEVDTEAITTATVSAKASADNISYLAFTATPKAKTMELFGRPGPDGVPVAFHRYSMRQAIEEGYILDVLLNYTPYKVAFKVAHDGQEYDSETLDKSKAVKSVMRSIAAAPRTTSPRRCNRSSSSTSAPSPACSTATPNDGGDRVPQGATRYHRILTKYIADMGYTQPAGPGGVLRPDHRRRVRP
ncbi:MAG: hypothetical protein R2742_05820 [Micropruina glycogenica]